MTLDGDQKLGSMTQAYVWDRLVHVWLIEGRARRAYRENLVRLPQAPL